MSAETPVVDHVADPARLADGTFACIVCLEPITHTPTDWWTSDPDWTHGAGPVTAATVSAWKADGMPALVDGVYSHHRGGFRQAVPA